VAGAGWLQLEENSAEWNAAMVEASNAVDYWNGRRIEKNVVALSGLITAFKAVDEEDHLHLTMDVNGRAGGSLMVEVCASPSYLPHASLRFYSSMVHEPSDVPASASSQHPQVKYSLSRSRKG